MTLYPINLGNFKLDGGAMFGVVPKVMWNKLNPADENNLCNWALRLLLIEESNKLILIDTGIGTKQDVSFFKHYYLNNTQTIDEGLAIHGFKRDDITDVVLTHLHFDHCGGAIDKVNDELLPAFKNATYHSNANHWQWAIEPNDREKASFLKENILPIEQSGQLNFVDRPSPQNNHDLQKFALETILSGIIPQLSYKIVHGHTGAMMLPQILIGDKTIVYMADLLPSVAHIPIPYVMAYDMFPLTSLKEKKTFLTEAVENNYILFFEHDAYQEACTLQLTEKGIRQKDCGDLISFL